MIKNIEKILNVSETKLHYRKKETMTGLYFKEMLSKISGSKNEANNHKKLKNKNKDKDDTEDKEDIIDSSKKKCDGEGTFLDKLC